MSNKIKKGLGKGMNSLIGDYSMDFIINEEFKDVKPLTNNQEIVELNLTDIQPNPSQPRKTFDQELLEELAKSIKNQGVLQPILVEEIVKGKYSIIAGERRYRAAKLANLEKIPSIIKTFDDLQRYEVALIENIQRENLNAIEEAKAYSFLIDKSGLTQEELANKVGKSRSAVTNSIRLLQIPGSLQKLLLENKITAGHARAYLSVKQKTERDLMESKLQEGKLSVREAEKLAKDYNEGKRIIQKTKKKDDFDSFEGKSPDLIDAQEKFSRVLGKKIEINGSLDKGKIVISYNNIEELERLFRVISQERDLFEI